MKSQHSIKEIKGSVWSSDHEILGGAPVFSGTRVPISTYLDHVRKGIPFEIFSDDFPTVRPNQIQLLIEFLVRNYSTEKARANVFDSTESGSAPTPDESGIALVIPSRLDLDGFLAGLNRAAGYSTVVSERSRLSSKKE